MTLDQSLEVRTKPFEDLRQHCSKQMGPTAVALSALRTAGKFVCPEGSEVKITLASRAGPAASA